MDEVATSQSLKDKERETLLNVETQRCGLVSFLHVSVIFWSADVHLWSFFTCFVKIGVGRYIGIFIIGLADISEVYFISKIVMHVFLRFLN